MVTQLPPSFSGAAAAYLPYNPGAGAQCEGEDWIKTNKITSMDVACVHVYERQMEALPPTWQHVDFEGYMNYMAQKLEVLSQVAAEIGRQVRRAWSHICMV